MYLSKHSETDKTEAGEKSGSGNTNEKNCHADAAREKKRKMSVAAPMVGGLVGGASGVLDYCA